MTHRSITIIFPCLNEEKTISSSIAIAKKILRSLSKQGYPGEIIVVDNGSTDKSVDYIRKARVRLIHENIKGYGAAVRRGMTYAKGSYIIFADSDGTYDLTKIPSFIRELERGADLVIGSRFTGVMDAHAMPFLNKFLGNPLLTFMINMSFGTHISDSQTGMRALTKTAYKTLDLRANGMEFASEMIIKATLQKKRITEIPIHYSKRIGISKLKPLTDLWKHIKLILLYSPSYLFMIPGFILLMFGLVVCISLHQHGRLIANLFFDIHTFTLGFFSIQLGLQILLLGILSRVYTKKVLNLPNGPLLNFCIRYISVEALLLSGCSLLIASFVLFVTVYAAWSQNGFTHLSRIRDIISSAGLAGIGTQLIFSAIVYGLLKE